LTDFQDIWAALTSDGAAKASGMVVRRVGSAIGPATFLAIDCSSRRRWFIAEVDAASQDLQGLPNWREIALKLVGTTGTHDRSLGLELASADYVDVFSALCHDLAESLSSVDGSNKRLSVIRSRLRKWNQFLREHGRSGLSEDRVRGLFAELWVLESGLMKRMDAVDAVRCWKGPDADAHDFRRLDRGLEVKATGMAEPAVIFISNEEQLDDTGLQALWLHVAFLDESVNQGVSLPELIQRIRKKLARDEPASNLLAGKLVRAGYIEEAAPQYPRAYEVVHEAAFRIRDGFPRLIQPPQGVSAVKYRLGLDHIQRFRVEAWESLSQFCSEFG
jgi:hypothetical protein